MRNENEARASAPETTEPVRLRKPPKLRKHRNGARVRLNGRDYYCGPWRSKEAKARYAELLGEWMRHDCKLPPMLAQHDASAATINELIALYAEHELPTRPASMQARIKLALRPLHERYGDKLANDFAALDLSSLRADMLKAGKLSRSMVNQAVSLIRGVFAWGAGVSRVDERVPFRLAAVKGLRRGQGAREKKVVKPIDWATVEATLAHASEPIRGAVLVQWLSGARPGEVLSMTANDVDRSGKVWVYEPQHHKTEHHGRSRRIFFGAEAQAVMRPFLVRRAASLPLFAPAEALQQQKTEAAKRRRSRVQPSQIARARRRARRPAREVGERYDVSSYRRAIERAVNAANAAHKRDELRAALLAMAGDEPARARILDAIDRLPTHIKRPSRDRLVRRVGDALLADDARRADLAKIVGDVIDAPGRFQRWHPHRLRHAFAHRAVREVGDLEAVRCALGHASDAMTRHYAKPDDHKARLLAEAMG